MTRTTELMPVALAVVLLTACEKPVEHSPTPDEYTLTVLEFSVTEEPLAIDGATVVLDDADGVRVEQLTDADGQVTFDVLWEENGPYALTVDAGELGMKTYLGLDAANAENEVRFDELPKRIGPYVRLSGDVNPRTPDSIFLVGAHAAHWPQAYGSFQEAAGSYTLFVPRDEPSVLVGCEFRSERDGKRFEQPLFTWFRQPIPGLEKATTLELDLSEPIVPTVETGVVRVPPGRLSETDTFVYALMYSETSSFLNPSGFPSLVAPSAGGDSLYDMELTWVPPTDGERMLTKVYALAFGKTQETQAWRFGGPESWSRPVELLPLPVIDWSVPGGPSLERMALVSIPTDARASFAVHATGDDHPMWTIVGPPGARDLVVPPPPSSADEIEASEVEVWASLTRLPTWTSREIDVATGDRFWP